MYSTPYKLITNLQGQAFLTLHYTWPGFQHYPLQIWGTHFKVIFRQCTESTQHDFDESETKPQLYSPLFPPLCYSNAGQFSDSPLYTVHMHNHRDPLLYVPLQDQLFPSYRSEWPQSDKHGSEIKGSCFSPIKPLMIKMFLSFMPQGVVVRYRFLFIKLIPSR